MSTLWVHGHRRDARFGFDCQHPILTLRTSESPNHRGTSPGSSSGTGSPALSFSQARIPRRTRLSVHPTRGTHKTDPLPHTWTGFPLRNPWGDVPVFQSLFGCLTAQEQQGTPKNDVQLSLILSFCECPQQATEQTRTSIRMCQSLPTLFLF